MAIMRTALSIAGSDSSGGAGIQADLKTFAALGVYGMTVITALTAQNTCGVKEILDVDAAMVEAQMAAVFDDIRVDAVKIGMLSDVAIIETVAAGLAKYQARCVTLDPVMVSKSGSNLLKESAVAALIERLLPLATVITPNLHEAAVLVGFAVNDMASMQRAAVKLHQMGAANVIIKGGHLPGEACDLLFDGVRVELFPNERIDTIHTHGTGCTFSSAIAAGLARKMTLSAAVASAKRYITIAIEHGFKLGRGIGPTHHFYDLYSRCKMTDDLM